MKIAIIAATTAMASEITAARDVLSIRVPTIASRAGNNVTDAIIITATPIAIATEKPLTNARPMDKSPSNATTTVIPAKRTARPEVSIASTIDSSTDMPSCNASR